MPNIPETIAAFLATASIGAIWSCAAPEFGAQSVIDRFQQIEPRALITVDGYRYGGKDFDCSEKVGRIRSAIPDAEFVSFGYLSESGWSASIGGNHDDDGAGLVFEPVPFDHPLWILYSSGTTGLPKAIVHSHGGILVEQLKLSHLHLDVRRGDRYFWFTTTGWMMWNWVVGILLTEASIVLYDGSPSPSALWDLAADSRITTFGTSPAFLAVSMRRGLDPTEGRDLSPLRAVGCAGSPLSAEGFEWVYDKLGPDIWLYSASGGTDVCSAFLAGVPTLPVHPGELQARALGAKVESWGEDGRPHINQVGELVITEALPSMPIYLWGDESGERLRSSYFSTWPGVWRHGDWIEITDRGSAVIHGRSDSTINRSGVRMGTSEIYRAVSDIGMIEDALVVDVPREGAENWMPLFVVTSNGQELDDDLIAEIRARIRQNCSPRHVPDVVVAVPEIPRTLSGKVLEVPVKRLLMGADPESAASRESLANPAAFDWFVAFAESSRSRRPRSSSLGPAGQCVRLRTPRHYRSPIAIGWCDAPASARAVEKGVERMKLVGYTDKLSVEGGEELKFMVSSEPESYTAELVRLIHGHTHPTGPGFKAEAVDSTFAGDYAGQVQNLRLGSYVRVPDPGPLAPAGDFTVQMWIRPTMADKQAQTLISRRGEEGNGIRPSPRRGSPHARDRRPGRRDRACRGLG